MPVKAFLSIVIAMATLVVGVTLATAVLSESLATVLIPEKATLPVALNAVSRAARIPCFTNGVVSGTVTTKAFEGAIPGALKYISDTFDLYPVWRRREITFFRRYTAPSEVADVSFEELNGVAKDLRTIVHSAYEASGIVKGKQIQDKKDLVASFSPEQIQVMSTTGLPITALPPAQQQLCGRVNADVSFGNAESRTFLMTELLTHWPEAKLKLLRVSIQSEGPGLWSLNYPSPRGTGLPQTIAISRSNRQWPPNPVTSFAFATRDRPVAFSRCDRRVALPSGDCTLDELLNRLQTALGYAIRVPSYARGRSLVITGGTLRADDLADILCELYGWEVGMDSKGQASLARPRVTPGRSFAEIYREQLSMVPPALRMLVSKEDALTWEDRQMALATEGHKDVDWNTGLLVTQLSPAAQQRIVQVFAVQLLGDLTKGGGVLSASLPPPWALHPEQIILGWTPAMHVPASRRSPGRNSSATLQFKVPDGKGGFLSWACAAESGPF